jgi:hypothetical protein
MRKLHVPAVIAILVAATACGSSSEEDSASTNPDPVVETTDAAGDDFTGADGTPGSIATSETVDTGVDSAPVDSADVSAETILTDDPSGTDPSATPDDSLSDDDVTDDLLIPLDQVDDTPVCQAFGEFINGFSQVALAGAFAQAGDETGADPEAGNAIESIEVVLYLGLAEVVPELRDELPDVILDAFNPVFERIEATPGLMTDAGFSEAEIDEFIATLSDDAEQPDESPSSDPRIVAAADALIAEYGTFESVLEELDTSDAADEEEGDAWISDTCPELSTLLDS